MHFCERHVGRDGRPREAEADTHTVVVQGWGVPGSSPFELHTWLLGSAAAGNMTVAAPASATLGLTGEITLTSPSPTIVRVDTP